MGNIETFRDDIRKAICSSKCNCHEAAVERVMAVIARIEETFPPKYPRDAIDI